MDNLLIIYMDLVGGIATLPLWKICFWKFLKFSWDYDIFNLRFSLKSTHWIHMDSTTPDLEDHWGWSSSYLALAMEEKILWLIELVTLYDLYVRKILEEYRTSKVSFFDVEFLKSCHVNILNHQHENIYWPGAFCYGVRTTCFGSLKFENTPKFVSTKIRHSVHNSNCLSHDIRMCFMYSWFIFSYSLKLKQ